MIAGGTGATGRATARRLLAHGWDVDVTGRNPAHMPRDLDARFVAADRRDRDALVAVFGNGADLLVDCVCYTAADAELLLPLARNATSTVMLSSKAVYVDAAGNHSNSDERPRFDAPIHEAQPTMAAGGGDHQTREGYGANKVAAERVLLDSGLPVTVLRPLKITAPARRARANGYS
jgi:nucleoside-diphosphate-sugar epimerase